MNLVDSSGWLEYFADGPNADSFAEPLGDPETLIVPVIALYEVFRVVARERDENAAFRAIAAMHNGRIVNVDAALAVAAARLSPAHGLPMADSLILAAARAENAILWTQDAHFKDLPGVHFFPKK